ncbi:spermatogenesis-associated protein 17 [Trichechus manatus latirostris]|uniref:Spermatogenesis-associated protein 17 n=1 Tax=Trichechus manatus latirostris TaxID=127582 RepID=A0A2Y9DK55_TRIMA|nr:spermatogenesis-associated protein 17 [Trichechus manatus latirostris]
MQMGENTMCLDLPHTGQPRRCVSESPSVKSFRFTKNKDLVNNTCPTLNLTGCSEALGAPEKEALEEFAEMKEREEKKTVLEREEKKRDHQARKMHYLLSTKQIPGIYNSPFRKEPDPWELRLRKAKPLTHRRAEVTQKCCINLGDWLACTSSRSFPRSEILPPINRKQCQGPFRDIAEVLQQRYKPLEPTLRVAEPISESKDAREAFRREEWARNINDNMFLPFSSYHKDEKYTPSMHSSSKYGADSYGHQRFRDENPKKWINVKGFQTVLPSFDLFSKYGKLYSKAGQIV